MIPKIIHYCWFGESELPDYLNKYIEGWRVLCPEYEIVQWNETNFDFSKYRYSKEAYENKQWAYVSDVARLEAIYEHGGIYLDTDVEMLKKFDSLLKYRAFIGAEDKYDLNTGAAFGAERQHPFVYENLMEYKDLPLIIEEKYNKLTCVEITTRVMRRHGYRKANKIQNIYEVQIFPTDFFSPMKLSNNKITITENTYSIHRYTTNWKSRSKLSKIVSRKSVVIKKFLRRNIDSVCGEGTYSRMKMKIK